MDNKIDILQVVRIRTFLFLWLGQVTSQIATNMLSFILVLRVYQTTGSNTIVSVLILSIGLPALLFGMVAGVYVDRCEKKLVLVFCNLLRAVAVLGFFLSSETFIWVIVLAVFLSTVTQFFVPAEAPTIPTLVPEKLLLTANSMFTFTFYGSIMVGYILAGPALRTFGPRNVFLLVSIIYFIAAFFVRFLPGSSSRKILIGGIRSLMTAPVRVESLMPWKQLDKLIQIKRELLEGYSYIKSHKKIMYAITLLTAAQAIISVLAALAPGFADKVLAVDVEDSSFLLMGPAALGLVFGALFVSQFGKKWARGKIVNYGVFLGGFSLLLLSSINRLRGVNNPLVLLDYHFLDLLHLAMFLLFMAGVANAFIDITSNTALQEETNDDIRGRVYGVLTALIGGVSILPVVVAGILSDLFGVGKVIFVTALIILAFGFYRVRKLRYNTQEI